MRKSILISVFTLLSFLVNSQTLNSDLPFRNPALSNGKCVSDFFCRPFN
jgi:hypothetical protein